MSANFGNNDINTSGSITAATGNFTTSLEVSGIPVPTGVGTTNYLTKWTSTNSIGNGIIYDDGTNVGIGTASPNYPLDVNGDAQVSRLFVKDIRTRLEQVNNSLDIYSATYNIRLRTGTPANPPAVDINNILYDAQPWVTINPSGDNIDFIVHGSGASNTNTLYVDASTGRVGIGTATPSRQFHTAGSTALIADGSTYELDISASAATLGGNRFQLLGTETVFNEAGGNFDFRVEGDTDSNLLSVDASQDRVGIGILVPQAKLDVRGSLYANDVVTLGSGSIPLTRSPIELLNKTNIAELQINESYTFPTSDGTSGQALVTDGSGSVSWTNITLNQTVNGRLTLESGVPISTTDQTAKTTLYFTPYLGNQIALYNGTEWKIYSFSQLSLSLSGYTANTNYDIFIYNNSGTLTLESTAWTDDTTRATSLTTQDGVYVKSGANTRRYLGTIRITGTTGQCEDSLSRRFIWNLYNQVEKLLDTSYLGQTHSYTTLAWRPWNNNTTVGQTRTEFVRGLNIGLVRIKTWSESTNGYSSIAVDSTTAALLYHKTNSGGTGAAVSNFFTHSIEAGYHYLQGLQFGIAGTTFYSLSTQNSFLG